MSAENPCLSATSVAEFLKIWIDSRNAKRTHPLSLRSVAANLGISPSMLSRLLSGTRNLSPESYTALSDKMKLTPEERELFQKLIQNTRVQSSREKWENRRIYGRNPRPASKREHRYLGSETFHFDEELLPDAKKVIDRCLEELISLSRQSQKKSSFYRVGIELSSEETA